MKLIRFILIFGALWGSLIKAQEDSLNVELKKIHKKTNILKEKDSLREVLLREEFANLAAPKSAELEKYKKELRRIREDDSLRLAQEKEEINRLREKVEPHLVQFDHKILFKIYSGLGPFSAKDRALNATQQIEKVFEGKIYIKDSLKAQKAHNYINILYSGNIITSISEEDALWEESTQEELADRYLNIIQTSVEASREAHTFENTVSRWLQALGIVVGFVLLSLLTDRLFGFVIRKIICSCERKEGGLEVKNYQVMNNRQLKKFLVRILKWLRIIIKIFLFGVSLSLIFIVFPATEHWMMMLLHWLSAPLKEVFDSFVEYIPNMLRIIIILIVGNYLNKLLRFITIEIEREKLRIKGFHTEWARPTYQLMRIFLVAFTIIMVFPFLPGADTSAFKGISVFFGVILSLGSSSAIANTIAGFIITYMRPFKVGDWIKVNDITGQVIEKTALVTRLRTINNEDVTVPNSMILTNKTINYSSSTPEKGLILNVEMSLRHDIPYHTINHLMIKAALETVGIEPSPAPYVLKNKILETNVVYQLNAYTLQPDRMFYIISDLNENLIKTFEEAGIPMLSPVYYPKPKTD